MKKHVMLIDDNEVENFIAKMVLSKSNMAEKITSFRSVPESLEYLDSLQNNPQEYPDLIFLDINMPFMNGFDFLERFDLMPEEMKNQCHVVMLSSSDEQNDMEQAMSYPVVKNYIVKPLKASDLVGL